MRQCIRRIRNAGNATPARFETLQILLRPSSDNQFLGYSTHPPVARIVIPLQNVKVELGGQRIRHGEPEYPLGLVRRLGQDAPPTLHLRGDYRVLNRIQVGQS